MASDKAHLPGYPENSSTLGSPALETPQGDVSIFRSLAKDASEAFNTVRQHPRIFGSAAAAILSLAFLYAFLTKPIYTSTGLVLTSDRQASLVSPISDLLPGMERGGEATELQILRSRDLLLQIFRQHGLHLQPLDGESKFTFDIDVITGDASPIPEALQAFRAAVDDIHLSPTQVKPEAITVRRTGDSLDVAVLDPKEETEPTFIPVAVGEQITLQNTTIKFRDFPVQDGSEYTVRLTTNDWLYRTYAPLFVTGLIEYDKITTSLVRVNFTAADRNMARSIVDTAMDLYIQKSLRLQVTNAELSLKFITGRLQEVEASLLKAERELSDFAKGEGAIALEEQARTTVENASELQLDRVRTALQLSAVEGLLGRLRTWEPGKSAALTGNYMMDPILERSVAEFTKLENDTSQMRATLRDDHPEIQRRMKQLEERQAELSKQLRSARRVLRAHMTELDNQVLGTTDTLREFPEKMLELKRHERDVAVFMGLYRQLLEKGQQY